MNKLIYIGTLLLAFQAISDWKIRKEHSGITISTRKIGTSDFQEFKGITVIEDSELTEVLSVVLDVDNYKHLFPDCIEAHIIKEDGAYYDIHYFAVKAPWPVQDRDAVYEQKTTFSSNNDTAVVKLLPVPDEYPIQDDRYRMREGTGFWKLYRNAKNNSVTVIYQFHGAPGGNIPAWLANQSVTAHPFKTLNNLREIIDNQK